MRPQVGCGAERMKAGLTGHLAPYQVKFTGLAKRLADDKKLAIEHLPCG